MLVWVEWARSPAYLWERIAGMNCGSEFIREEASTSEAFVSPVIPLSRMNSLPQYLLPAPVSACCATARRLGGGTAPADLLLRIYALAHPHETHPETLAGNRDNVPFVAHVTASHNHHQRFTAMTRGLPSLHLYSNALE